MYLCLCCTPGHECHLLLAQMDFTSWLLRSCKAVSVFLSQPIWSIPTHYRGPNLNIISLSDLYPSKIASPSYEFTIGYICYWLYQLYMLILWQYLAFIEMIIRLLLLRFIKWTDFLFIDTFLQLFPLIQSLFVTEWTTLDNILLSMKWHLPVFVFSTMTSVLHCFWTIFWFAANSLFSKE